MTIKSHTGIVLFHLKNCKSSGNAKHLVCTGMGKIHFFSQRRSKRPQGNLLWMRGIGEAHFAGHADSTGLEQETASDQGIMPK